ncbi:hypothetical protein ACR5KS_04185 [Leucobacter sp. W1153]|uniref:hypothetical protein n=1 Tax=Leucobacter sp. W1153 TaxID=3439064 RepID=UPI003F2D0EC7
MTRAWKVARLHLNKPFAMFGIPTFIVLLVLVITALISFALQRAGLDPSRPEYAAGARMNGVMVFSLPGFLIYFGVQAIATTFPFSLALGATRRAHVFGTAIANLVLAGYVACLMLVLLWIELATDHWFFGVYALDTVALGSGNGWILWPAVLLGTWLALTIGGLFGGVWVRFGSRGPVILGLVLALAVAVTILVFVPQFAEIIAAVTRPRLALVAVGAGIVALLGTWLSMRRASVR